MLTKPASPTENKSRFIESAVVFVVTVSLFFIFGYNEEFRYQLKQAPLFRIILRPLYIALIPSALMLGTIYVASYYQSRFVAWAVYALGFFLVVAYYYPNFHDLFFSLAK
jgi:hypothetical protein